MSLIDEVLEEGAVRERWGQGPQLRFDNKSKRLGWDCRMDLKGNEFKVRIEYPPGYPAKPPEIRILMDFARRPPHLFGGNVLCWLHSEGKDRLRNTWQPGLDTAAEAMSAARQWLLAFMVWDVLDVWVL